MQMLDEEWWFGAALRRKLTLRNKCTVVGVSRTEQHLSFIAQNMDIPTYVNPHLVVLKVRSPKSSFEQLILTLSGLISLNGMNNRRLVREFSVATATIITWPSHRFFKSWGHRTREIRRRGTFCPPSSDGIGTSIQHCRAGQS
jgi:hypothetical protein